MFIAVLCFRRYYMTNPMTWTFSVSLYSAISLGKFYVNGHAHVSICSSYVVLEKFVLFANVCVDLYAFYMCLERCIGMRINSERLCSVPVNKKRTPDVCRLDGNFYPHWCCSGDWHTNDLLVFYKFEVSKIWEHKNCTNSMDISIAMAIEFPKNIRWLRWKKIFVRIRT